MKHKNLLILIVVLLIAGCSWSSEPEKIVLKRNIEGKLEFVVDESHLKEDEALDEQPDPPEIEISDHQISTREMPIREMSTHEMPVREMSTREMSVREMPD